jgi:hypothetical protein
MLDEARTARLMWTLLEPLHAVTYFSGQARAAFEGAGLRGFWRGYFAGRAAPLGAVGPGVVTASFFGFAPGMVQRALPAVWEMAPPPVVLSARVEGAAAALREALPHDPAPVVARLEPVVAGLDCAGRVLAAANAALPGSADPFERLWQIATVLREHRGDGHVAALVAAGLDGCETLVWRSLLDLDRGMLQPARGWTDEEWQAAHDRLAGRGWLTADGAAGEQARRVHRAVEEATDRAAGRVWAALPEEEVAALAEGLLPLAEAVGVPQPNPIGLPPAGTVATAEVAR